MAQRSRAKRSGLKFGPVAGGGRILTAPRGVRIFGQGRALVSAVASECRNGYRREVFTSHFIRAAILLAGASVLSRLTFRHFETRWQILIFWGIVIAYQLALRPAFGRRISLPSTALDLLVVTVAIIGVKVAIEGRVWP
jgi:predicted cobalt transporter CbtA